MRQRNKNDLKMKIWRKRRCGRKLKILEKKKTLKERNTTKNIPMSNKKKFLQKRENSLNLSLLDHFFWYGTGS